MSGCGLDLRTELNLNPYRTIIPCLTLRVQLPDSGKNEELGKEAENAPAAPAGPPSPGATPAVLPRAAKEASRAIFAPLLRTPSTLLSMLNPAVKKKVWEAWPIPIPGEGEGAGAPLIPWHRFHAYLIFRAGGSSEPSSGHSSNAKPRQILRVVGQHKETSVIIQLFSHGGTANSQHGWMDRNSKFVNGKVGSHAVPSGFKRRLGARSDSFQSPSKKYTKRASTGWPGGQQAPHPSEVDRRCPLGDTRRRGWPSRPAGVPIGTTPGACRPCPEPANPNCRKHRNPELSLGGQQSSCHLWTPHSD